MATADKPTPPSLIDLLEKRYDNAQGWLLFYEVSNGTGTKGTNYADALAMSIWPSRGIALHGFELKRSRTDLLKELRSEAKAHAFQKYCNHFWLVLSDSKLAEGVEVPATWGVLAPRNNVLYQVRPAPKLVAEEWKPHFIAAMMRRFHEAYINPKQAVNRVEVGERAQALASAMKSTQANQVNKDLERKLETLEYDLKRLRENVHNFESKSGLQVAGWNAGQIGQTVRWLLDGNNSTHVKRNIEASRRAVEQLQAQLEVVQSELGQLDAPVSQEIGEDR